MYDSHLVAKRCDDDMQEVWRLIAYLHILILQNFFVLELTVKYFLSLTAAECGKTMFLNAGTPFSTTLPAISTVDAGCSFKFIVATASTGGNHTIITGNSLENVLAGGINLWWKLPSNECCLQVAEVL